MTKSSILRLTYVGGYDCVRTVAAIVEIDSQSSIWQYRVVSITVTSTIMLGTAVVVSFVIVRLCLVVLHSYTPQIFTLQPSSINDEESKSRRNRIPIGPMIIMHTTHLSIPNLSRGLESLGETTDVVGEVTLVAEELDVGTVNLDLALLAEVNVLLALEGSETPVLGDDDLLATGELQTN